MANDSELQENKPNICAFDAGVETRLTCTQCDTPICPKCMIPAEVGFKCRNCVRQIRSHVTDISRAQFMKAAVFSAIAGYAYGWVHPFLVGFPFFRILGIPIVGLVLAYLLGKGVGNLIQGWSGNKLGLAMRSCVLVAALVGVFLGPFRSVIIPYFELLLAPSNPMYYSSPGTAVVFQLLIHGLVVVVFLKGLQAPFAFKR